jgi:cytochrome P450 family 135
VQTIWSVRWPLSLQRYCHRRFGDHFTLRMVGQLGTTVNVADPVAVKAIFTGDPAVFRAGAANSILEPLLGAHSVLLLDGASHLRKRRLMLPPFHGKAMQRYAELIEEITVDEIQRWPLENPFGLRPRTQAITLEVIMRAVFGIEDAARLREVRPLIRRLVNMTMGPGAAMLPFVGRSRRRSRWTPWARFQRAVESVDAVIFDEIARRRADPESVRKDDVLSMLLQARDENGRGMTDAELRDELVTLLLAGHETTATAAAWAVELLLRNSEALARLRRELAEGRTEYLDAAIREALRVRPVIPAIGRRLAAPATLNGNILPAGINVSPSIYLLHRRPEIYPQPEEFRPERFLQQPPDGYEWIPFGGGTRRCLGASFAMLELRVVLSTILGHAVLALVDKRPDRMTPKAVVLVPHRGVRVRLESRVPQG